jgi:acyl carrier protein
MNDDMIIAKIEQVFRDFFEDDGIKLNMDSTSADFEDWDSIAHIQIIYGVEEAFDVQFDADDIMNMFEIRFIVEKLREAGAGA